MKLKLLLLSALISLAGTAHAQRIVVLTPDTADIVAALGALTKSSAAIRPFKIRR